MDWWANVGGFFGVTSDQLRQAAEYYLQVKTPTPNATISFTGHSLGGGLASLAAFAPPVAGLTTLPDSYASSLNSVIAANWQ